MELRVLQYFLAIAREQSIIKAAQSLHLSQPTLSTQIKKLEEELGKQLLIRGSNGSRKVTLTNEGLILKKRAEEILDLVKKTENEITVSNQIIKGDVYIGTGETDAIRIIARITKKLHTKYPQIHYHFSSGNADFVTEQLDKGLIDFGIVFGNFDLNKYDAIKLPAKDVWGVLLPRNASLAKKEAISVTDLIGLPLIVSHQKNQDKELNDWFGEIKKFNIVATYNLLFNASLLVDEGLGYAIGLDKIINTSGNSRLCFRPLIPKMEIEMHLIFKKHQVFSKAAKEFLKEMTKLQIE